MDIEGGECEAFRGMRGILNASAPLTFIGALIEFDKSRACCQELIDESTQGAFWTLANRHGLCVYLAPAQKPAHTRPTPLARLCEIRGAARQLNLRWEPCDNARRVGMPSPGALVTTTNGPFAGVNSV